MERIRNILSDDVRRYGRTAVAVIGIWAAMTILTGHTCFTRLLFGIPCPWCGITRALVLMVTGRFADSWRMHPMAGFYVILAAAWFVTHVTGKGKTLFVAGFAVIMAVTIAVFIFRLPGMFPAEPPLDYNPDNLLARFLAAGGL